MLEFEVNGSLSCRENDLLNLLAPRDLVNLSDVLEKSSQWWKHRQTKRTYLSDELVEEALTELVAMRMPF